MPFKNKPVVSQPIRDVGLILTKAKAEELMEDLEKARKFCLRDNKHMCRKYIVSAILLIEESQ